MITLHLTSDKYLVLWYKSTMQWIYLSPHLDDVALSCGGLLWEQAQAGDRPSVWTICAGDPPPGEFSAFTQALHTRWQTGPQAVALRRAEDRLSCQRLSAEFRHFTIPDCIYRRVESIDPTSRQTFASFPYASETSLFGPVHPAEAGLRKALSAQLAAETPAQAEVVCPLALGGHVDHRLVRQAARKLENPSRRLWYYADYPYVLRNAHRLNQLRRRGWESIQFPISPAGLLAWRESIAAHASQISTFWPALADMHAAIQRYAEQVQGVLLWRRPDRS